MRTSQLIVLCVALVCATTTCASAADATGKECPIVKLWPATVPGKVASKKEQDDSARGDGVRRITNVSEPTLTVLKVQNAHGPTPAVVVCPGGGYAYLSFDLEGTEIAQWLNSIGVSAFILKYRAPDNRDGAFQDAQRAIRLIRQHSEDWNVDAKRVGILGFSAGGHLAARTSTAFDTKSYDAVDDADKLSCRPDFTVLIYPAYLYKGDYQLVEEVPVTPHTPPAFIAQTQDDTEYVGSSIAFYLAVKKANIPAELHLFPKGGHGYGLRPSKRVASAWPKLCEEWLRDSGVLGRSGQGQTGGR